MVMMLTLLPLVFSWLDWLGSPKPKLPKTTLRVGVGEPEDDCDCDGNDVDVDVATIGLLLV